MSLCNPHKPQNSPFMLFLTPNEHLIFFNTLICSLASSLFVRAAIFKPYLIAGVTAWSCKPFLSLLHLMITFELPKILCCFWSSFIPVWGYLACESPIPCLTAGVWCLCSYAVLGLCWVDGFICLIALNHFSGWQKTTIASLRSLQMSSCKLYISHGIGDWLHWVIVVSVTKKDHLH